MECEAYIEDGGNASHHDGRVHMPQKGYAYQFVHVMVDISMTGLLSRRCAAFGGCGW
jgi:hypothetical protein